MGYPNSQAGYPLIDSRALRKSAKVGDAVEGTRARPPNPSKTLGYGVIGSTTDSGSVSLGSSPGTPANSRGATAGREPGVLGPSGSKLMPPSSSGPGRRSLKAVTAVRIRSGVHRGEGPRGNGGLLPPGPPSSSGPGRRSLKAVTAVRIRSGVPPKASPVPVRPFSFLGHGPQGPRHGAPGPAGSRAPWRSAPTWNEKHVPPAKLPTRPPWPRADPPTSRPARPCPRRSRVRRVRPVRRTNSARYRCRYR